MGDFYDSFFKKGFGILGFFAKSSVKIVVAIIVIAVLIGLAIGLIF